MTEVVERELVDLTALELSDSADADGRHPHRATGTGRAALRRRRTWMCAMAIAVAWSLWDAGFGRKSIVNGGGWTVASRFVTAAWRPELGGDFLGIVIGAAATTAGFALVGTALALAIGVVGGVLTSETFWERDVLDRTSRRWARRSRGSVRAGWMATRLIAVLPRGIHEAIWGLVLLLILGANPMVAVLAIGIPFGAITAKVVGELIDDTASGAYRALRAAGSPRVTALVYGVAPIIVTDVVSYGFYRLECSVRSSVVLGMIGAGGIGFQIAVSEDGLHYDELWTLIYVLIAMSAVADGCGARLRQRPSRRRLRVSVATAVLLTAISVWRLELRPWELLNPRTREFATGLAADAWPPRLPRGGWGELIEGMVETLQLSIIAIAFAALVAVPMAFLAARPPSSNTGARLAAAAVRTVLLLFRAIPPPLWALVILFVVLPGPVPGGIALGIYTLGILGRLDAEVVENADAGPTLALRLGGASTATAFAYGMVPTVTPRFVSLSLYRWEVAIRETVIVGLVGAGGLGQLLSEQKAGLDEARMLTTIVALIALAFVVDMISSRLRAALR